MHKAVPYPSKLKCHLKNDGKITIVQYVVTSFMHDKTKKCIRNELPHAWFKFFRQLKVNVT